MAGANQSGRTWPVALTLTIAFATIARTFALGHWPGINADEAWYGVTMQDFLAGRPALLTTPPGNPLNPVHSAPLWLLLRFMNPTPAILRVPEVLWGLLAVLVAYPLLAKPLGRRTAHFVVMLLAVSPVAIAYSRFGWDPSGTVLVSLLAVGFALRNQPVAAVLCLLTALIVHPTNVFLAPIALLAWGPHGLDRYRAASPALRHRLHVFAGIVTIVSVPLAWWVLKGIAANPNTALPSVTAVVARTVSVRAWGDLMLGLAGLFSGVTTATFISGPLPFEAVVIARLTAGIALLAPVAIGWYAFRARPHAVFLLGGVAVSLAIFHAVAGPAALQPGLERYALFIVVPLTILCAIALDTLAETRPAVTAIVFSLTFGCFVAVSCGGYFYPLAARGGESATAFRTGAMEPKFAAYNAILAESSSSDVVAVVAEDWWLYWPLRYFGGAAPQIHVEMMPGAAAPGGLYPAGATPPSYPRPPTKRYAVVFEGSEAWSRMRSSGRTVFTAFDPVGRPILHVIALPSAPE